jgi:NAD(P)H-dependent FMN reductase
VRPHHRVEQADAARQPGRTDMRERVQGAGGEEEQREIGLRDAVAPEEPVGDERRVEEAAADAVETEEERQARDDAPAARIECDGRRGGVGTRRDLDAGRQREIRRDAGEHQCRTAKERRAVRRRRRERGGVRQERRDGRRERADGVAGIEHEVVPRERPRPPGRGHRRREDGLIERGSGTAIAAHSVEHAGKGQRQERRLVREERERQISRGRQHSEGDERLLAAPDVAMETDDHGRQRRTGESEADEEADARGREPDVGEIDRQGDADEAHGRGAEERGRVDQPSVFSNRGASPLGIPGTLPRVPLCRRAPLAWLTRVARSHGLAWTLLRLGVSLHVNATAHLSLGMPARTQQTAPNCVNVNGIMARLIGISGSLRAGSFNTALLRVAASLMPEGSTLDMRTLHGIPLYNGDDEAAHGIPEAVATLKDAIVAADGLLLVSPEYNNSIPGVFKNAIDWLSRPPADIKRVFGGRPVAIMGASPGNFGTLLAQAAWLPVLRTLGAEFWSGGRLMVSRAAQAFADDGTLTDETARRQLQQFMTNFVAFVDRQPGR